MLPISRVKIGKLLGDPISTIKNATKKYFIDFTKPYKSQYYYVSRDLLQPLWDLCFFVPLLILSPIAMFLALIAGFICLCCSYWLNRHDTSKRAFIGEDTLGVMLFFLMCPILLVISTLNLILTPLTYLKILIREGVTMFISARKIEGSPTLIAACNEYRRVRLKINPARAAAPMLSTEAGELVTCSDCMELMKRRKTVLEEFKKRKEKGQETGVVIKVIEDPDELALMHMADSICEACGA